MWTLELTSHDLPGVLQKMEEYMKVDYVKLGKKVRYYREKAGLSQIQLAELIDISRPYISQVENGVFNVSLEIIVSIASVLKVPIGKLLKDSLDEESETMKTEVDEILLGCSPEEERILTKNMKDLRETIRPYGIK